MYLVYVERNGRLYGYLAKSFRDGQRVRQRKTYYGFLGEQDGDRPERLTLKDLIWFLKGEEGIAWLRPEEFEKWRTSTNFYNLRPFCDFATFDEAKDMIHSLIKKVDFGHCALCYIVKYGIPARFKPVFDDYDITEPLMKATNELAEFAAKPGFIPHGFNEYCTGKPEEYERMRQFLKEDAETQMKPKGDGQPNKGGGAQP